MIRRLLLSCVAAASMVGVPIAAANAKAVTPYPIEYWAAPEFMDNVEVSPDGKYLAFVKAESQMGDNIIEIYEADNMAKEPRRVGAESMNLRSFSWISNNEMLVSFDKQVRSRIRGFNQGAFRGKLALYSVDSNEFRELSGDDFGLELINILPNEPNHVLVRWTEFEEGKSFRVPSYYRYNLRTGQRTLVLRGSGDLFSIRFDPEGNPRFATRFDEGSEEFIFLYRPAGGSGWEEYFRISRDSFESFSYAGMIEGNPDEIYVIAHNGQDKTALWRYNLKTKSFGKKVYGRDDVDLLRTVRHTNAWANPGKVTGVLYATDKVRTAWMDAEEKAIIDQFKEAIPNAHRVTITTRSQDGNTLVVRNSGPRDPGTFYLFDNGKFSQLGSVNGLLEPSNLADVEYISYKARDGRTITGYVTRPQGEGPFPLIVMPHGGPFVSEVVAWDDWGQMLANNGYMVLQPQYRGSQKYGLEFYKSAFIDGGEGGHKMQDDKDDGVLHLIETGDVDPDRVAMFGWSYGGYAALIAAAREPNLYQCVIAGAAVADNNQQVNYYRNDIEGSQRVEQLRFWDDSISPIEEASKVNVPMLVIHGSIDQRVPVSHSRKYIEELEKYGKDFEYIELEDADHFSNTLFYNHKMSFYPRMIDYLKNDCGPGGL